MCQISLVAALTTAEPTPSQTCTLGVDDYYIVQPCSGHKTMHSVHREVSRGDEFDCLALSSVVFVRQED